MLDRSFPTTEEKIEKSKQCYRKENKKPCIGFFVGDEYPNIRYDCYDSLPDNRPLKPRDFLIKPFISRCDSLLKEHEECGGDLFFTGTPFWGIPWIEAMLGFDIISNSTSHSIMAENLGMHVTPDTIPVFSMQNEWVKLYSEYCIALSASSKGRYPLGTTRIRGLADILSVLFGAENLIILSMTEPEIIEKALKKITPFYIALMQYQLSVIPLFHEGLGSFYYYNWTPSNTVWHQEDSVMLLSPQIYHDLIEKYDQQIYSSFENNICHFHSVGGFAPWKEILSLNPLAVEMHLDYSGPSAQDLYNTHKQILDKTSLIIWGKFTKNDLDWIYRKLPPEGLFLSVRVDNKEQAKEILDLYY